MIAELSPYGIISTRHAVTRNVPSLVAIGALSLKQNYVLVLVQYLLSQGVIEIQMEHLISGIR